MATHFYTASSIDGFIATPEHSLEWLFTQDFDWEGPMAYSAFILRLCPVPGHGLPPVVTST